MTWPFSWWRRMFTRPATEPADPPPPPDHPGPAGDAEKSGKELRRFVSELQNAVACKSAAAHAEIDAAEAELAMARAAAGHGGGQGA
jgi:hypothetical protein